MLPLSNIASGDLARELKRLRSDYASYHHYIFHKKILEVYECVLDGYKKGEYKFYPPGDTLNQYFEWLAELFLVIDQREEFESIPITNLRGTKTFHDNSEYLID